MLNSFQSIRSSRLFWIRMGRRRIVPVAEQGASSKITLAVQHWQTCQILMTEYQLAMSADKPVCPDCSQARQAMRIRINSCHFSSRSRQLSCFSTGAAHDQMTLPGSALECPQSSSSILNPPETLTNEASSEYRRQSYSAVYCAV